MAGLWHTMSHEEYINVGNRGTGLSRVGQSEPGYELASKRLGILQKKKKKGVTDINATCVRGPDVSHPLGSPPSKEGQKPAGSPVQGKADVTPV